MLRLAAILLTVLAIAACSSPAPSTPSPPTAKPTSVPVDSSGLRVGQMAVVKAGVLRQVADPNHPEDRAFESPASAVGQILQPLGESQHVLIVGGPTNPSGDVYWRVADDPFPGCCAPFGWVKEFSSKDVLAIEAFHPSCPDPTTPITGNQLLALGVMEASTCFGTDDFQLRGDVRCAQPVVNQFLSITGPDWTNDQTLCDIDQAVALYGPAVTSLYNAASADQGFDGDVALSAHFNDPSSADCRWAPGNAGSFSFDESPVDTAQFACRMSVYVTAATPAAQSTESSPP